LNNPADKKSELSRDYGDLKSHHSGAPAELAGALHDVSNALTVVAGWLEVALGKATASEMPPDVLDAIDVALSHARFGHRVARRAIGGATEPEADCSTLSDILATSLRAIEPMAAQRQVTVVTEGAQRSDVLLASPDAATQILVNLLLNALSFSPRNGHIAVSCKVSRHSVILTVADEGPGIEASRASEILEAPNSTRQGGTGIGLTHSASLARDNGGHLRLVRHAPHAVFELRWQRVAYTPEPTNSEFPPVEELSRPYSSRPVNSLELGGLNVLLLEDDDAICSLVELAFFARGSMVRSASTFLDAKRFCDVQEFDVALVDLSPIVNDVSGALQALRSRRDFPVVLITGSATGMPPGAERLFSSWVRKPFEAGELIEAVRRATGRS
jgi:CheY-like chemotaxis protein